MVPYADPIAEYPATSFVAACFVVLVAAAWFTSHPGVAIALAYYGAVVVSECLYRRLPSSTNGTSRSVRLLGLALTWLAVLAFSAVVLPSNFSRAVI